MTNKEKRLTHKQAADQWSKGSGKKDERLKGESLERFLNHLLLEDILEEDFQVTAYSTISYLSIGHRAAVVERGAYRVMFDIINELTGGGGGGKVPASLSSSSFRGESRKRSNGAGPSSSRGSASSGKKRRQLKYDSNNDDDDDNVHAEQDGEDDDKVVEVISDMGKQKNSGGRGSELVYIDIASSDDE